MNLIRLGSVIFEVFWCCAGYSMILSGPFPQVNQAATFSAKWSPGILGCPFHHFTTCGAFNHSGEIIIHG
jgi:hypothetical protein